MGNYLNPMISKINDLYDMLLFLEAYQNLQEQLDAVGQSLLHQKLKKELEEIEIEYL